MEKKNLIKLLKILNKIIKKLICYYFIAETYLGRNNPGAALFNSNILIFYFLLNFIEYITNAKNVARIAK